MNLQDLSLMQATYYDAEIPIPTVTGMYAQVSKSEHSGTSKNARYISLLLKSCVVWFLPFIDSTETRSQETIPSILRAVGAVRTSASIIYMQIVNITACGFSLPHYHPDTTEMNYVLEGEALFWIIDAT